MGEKECMEKLFIIRVIENHETESGITIHYVNKLYDEGDIIFQARCKVDTAILLILWPQRFMLLNMSIIRGLLKSLISKLPDLLIKGAEEA